MRCFLVDFSEMGSRLRTVVAAKASWRIAILLLAIQAMVSLFGGHREVEEWFRTFGLSREGLRDLKLWQFVSYGLLHGNFLHVGLNAACIVLLGARIEHMLGAAAVWKTMAFGILGGGLAYVLLAPSVANVSSVLVSSVLVGASGGCMALLILLTTLSPDSRMWPIPVSGRTLGIGIMAGELVLALVDPRPGLPGLSRIGDMLVSQGLAGFFDVSHACHFGGGVAGFIGGVWLLRPRVTTARLRRDRERREARLAKEGGA